MSNFNLTSYLDDIYAAFPEGERRPVIGITANYGDGEARLSERYYKMVIAAGGVPVLVPPVADRHVIVNTLERLDGLLLSGGGDFNPLWCGEEPSPRLHSINATRDLPELLITRLAYNRQLPMLGICRGIQTLAMALDGEVDQDIEESEELRAETPNSKFLTPKSLVRHSQDADRSEPTHTIDILPDTLLHSIYGVTRMAVNSFHHQAVRAAGPRFRVSAHATDGVIEAIESSEHKAIMGVQWHPECLPADGKPLFQWLISEARAFQEAKAMHQRVLTLDTHCDTPMFFPQGIDFGTRDKRILVDLHKMTEGHQDAVTMAAYLPQPKAGEQFTEKVAFPVAGPRDYADLIFDKIEDIVRQHPDHLCIARTPADLYANKRMGRKSIVLAIENGLALEGNLQNVAHFAQRGVTYITLCHNGDNDICDSARGSNTHGGLSDFGASVVQEMNRLGIMVDLSHGGEKSFYDALDVSTMPIVCSHSNAKALCDVPRNLTDDQLRALARKGGVAHVTLYHGFLQKDGEATILDAIAHLEHFIKVMGIDHVGLGTDFDGDGGVNGLADSSELINFTRQLLRRKYSERDIAQIWGGNWLRVMEQVQGAIR